MCLSYTDRIAVHDECIDAAVSILEASGIDGIGAKYDARVARRLAPVCYLCGAAPSEHADHDVPKSAGGSDHWSNIGAACELCNLSKGAGVVTLTDDQARRLAKQHAAFRAAANRLTDRVWWQYLEPDIAFYLDEIGDDADLYDAEMVAEDVSDWVEGYEIKAPFVAAVVERVAGAFEVAAAQGTPPAMPEPLP